MLREKALCGFDCLVIVVQSTLGKDDVTLARKALAHKQNIVFVRSQCDVDFVKMNEEHQVVMPTPNEIQNHLKNRKFIKLKKFI